MGQCSIDHSLEDVKNKLESQRHHLPESIVDEWINFLNRDLSQTVLNEAFHLLKKYDLASKGEQQERENQMKQLFSNQ